MRPSSPRLAPWPAPAQGSATRPRGRPSRPPAGARRRAARLPQRYLALGAALFALAPPLAARADGIGFALRGVAGTPLSHGDRRLLLGAGADLGARLGFTEIGAYGQLTTRPTVDPANRQYRLGGQVLFRGEPPATPWGGLRAGYHSSDLAVGGVTATSSGWELSAQLGVDYGTYDGRFAAGTFAELVVQRSHGAAGWNTEAVLFAGLRLSIAALN